MVIEEELPKQWSISPINNSGRANLMANQNDLPTGEASEGQGSQGLANIKLSISGTNS